MFESSSPPAGSAPSSTSRVCSPPRCETLYRGNVEPYRHVLGYTLNAPGSRTYSDPAISGGGQAQTQITHSAALLFWLTGLRATEVAAVSESFELSVDLVDSAAIRFDGGAVGALSSTGSVLPGEDELLEYRIFGSRGHVLFDVNNATAAIHSAQRDCETLDPIPLADRYPEAAPASNLVDVCLGRGANGSPAEIGLRSVEFVDAIYRAARSGRAAQIP